MNNQSNLTNLKVGDTVVLLVDITIVDPVIKAGRRGVVTSRRQELDDDEQILWVKFDKRNSLIHVTRSQVRKTRPEDYRTTYERMSDHLTALVDEYVEEAFEHEDEDVFRETDWVDRYFDFMTYIKETKIPPSPTNRRTLLHEALDQLINKYEQDDQPAPGTIDLMLSPTYYVDEEEDCHVNRYNALTVPTTSDDEWTVDEYSEWSDTERPRSFQPTK